MIKGQQSEHSHASVTQLLLVSPSTLLVYNQQHKPLLPFPDEPSGCLQQPQHICRSILKLRQHRAAQEEDTNSQWIECPSRFGQQPGLPSHPALLLPETRVRGGWHSCSRSVSRICSFTTRHVMLNSERNRDVIKNCP